MLPCKEASDLMRFFWKRLRPALLNKENVCEEVADLMGHHIIGERSRQLLTNEDEVRWGTYMEQPIEGTVQNICATRRRVASQDTQKLTSILHSEVWLPNNRNI